MYEYYFLFVLGLLWLCFAVVQDIRTREIANWLNFSLLVFALSYRGFVALETNRPMFFWWGLTGTLFCIALAYLLYYGRAFAGGDAKLLMALGPLLPFEQLSDVLVSGLGFIFALFLLGSLYSLAYTFVLLPRRWSSFKRAFFREWHRFSRLFFMCLLLGVLLGLALGSFDYLIGFFLFLMFVLVPLLCMYGMAVESSFFINYVPVSRLTEGDWLARPVTAGRVLIRPSVHGLTLREIALLKKRRKQVLIKEGIPFSPAFLLAFVAMVFYVLR